MLMLQTLYNGPETNNITNNTSYNFVHVMLDTIGVYAVVGGYKRLQARRPVVPQVRIPP